MKKDITFPTVEGVQIGIIRKETEVANTYEWYVYLINQNSFPLTNVFVTSRGYGEEQTTSTLRHFFETVDAKSHVIIEPIDSSVFHLTNEYWVSYFANEQLFDKPFLFVPDSIVENNLVFINSLQMEGIFHK